MQERSEAIDNMMRQDAAWRRELAEVRAVQAEHERKLGELRHGGGHATRLQMEEQQKLEEKLAPLAAAEQHELMVHELIGNAPLQRFS